jgi:hypothetical protein
MTDERAGVARTLPSGSRGPAECTEPTVGNPLRPPQSHHNCVAVHGVRWRSTAIGDLQTPLGFGLWGSMANNLRIPDGPENHGVPGSNPGPATPKTARLQVKRPRIQIGVLRPTRESTTTSFSRGARNNAVPGTIDRLQNFGATGEFRIGLVVWTLVGPGQRRDL